MKSTIKNIFIDHEFNLSHFEYDLFYDNDKVGDFQLSFEKDFVTIATFRILKEFRGKDLSKKALKEIENQISQKEKDFQIKFIELNAKPYNNSPLTKEDLISFYQKHFYMSVYYADSEDVIMRRDYFPSK